MRKSLPVMAVTALALLLAACGESPSSNTSGLSGRAPDPEPTTTTEAPAPTTTAPPTEQIVDIPDIADLGLTWDEDTVVDEGTGTVNTGPFNQYLRAEAPNAMVPEGSFEGLDVAAFDDLLDEAVPEGPAKAITLFLGLDPDDDSVEMLVRQVGVPGTAEVVVVQLVDGDDSVRAVRWSFRVEMESRAGLAQAEEDVEEAAEGFEGDAVDSLEGDTGAVAEGDSSTEEEIDTQDDDPTPDVIPVIYGGSRTFQCQPGRGQQDFGAALCR